MSNGQIVPDPKHWRALAPICVAFFIVALDVSIVNVALPSIAGRPELRAGACAAFAIAGAAISGVILKSRDVPKAATAADAAV